MGGAPGKTGSSGSKSFGGQSDCNLEFMIRLFGPIPDVATSLAPGEKLSIHLITESTVPVVAVMTTGSPPQRAGTLAAEGSVPDLVDCISRGYVYQASIVSVDGSEIWLRVQRDQTP